MFKTLFLMAIFNLLSATTTVDVFRKFPNKYFVETGTYAGDGVQNALQAQFQEIYSIELSPYHYQCSSDRFRTHSNVHLFLGNSAYTLSSVLKEIDAPATFWLDSHYSSGTTARGETNTPILAELEAIRLHPIKTHTILIDDVRLFGTIEFDYIELNEIIAKLFEINPNYRISFEDGHVQKDVLVARI